MRKNNSQDSSKFNEYSSFQLLRNLTGKCHSVGNLSFHQR